jgi:hypothetical protein
MKPDIEVGDWVILEQLPKSVRADDPDDDIFRQSLGRKLRVVAIEENGDLELDVRDYSDRFLGIFVPVDSVRRED